MNQPGVMPAQNNTSFLHGKVVIVFPKPGFIPAWQVPGKLGANQFFRMVNSTRLLSCLFSSVSLGTTGLVSP